MIWWLWRKTDELQYLLIRKLQLSFWFALMILRCIIWVEEHSQCRSGVKPLCGSWACYVPLDIDGCGSLVLYKLDGLWWYRNVFEVIFTFGVINWDTRSIQNSVKCFLWRNNVHESLKYFEFLDTFYEDWWLLKWLNNWQDWMHRFCIIASVPNEFLSIFVVIKGVPRWNVKKVAVEYGTWWVTFSRKIH